MIMKIADRRLTFLLFLIVLGSALIAWHAAIFEHDDLIGTAAAASPKESSALPLKLVADVELPGPTNRFDYQSYDPRTHLLFIAHLAAGTVVVFNTESNKVIAEIPGISQVHGVLAVPDLNTVYASATGSNEVVAIDETTLKEVARMPGGVYPDGLAYAPDARKLYVSD